MKLGGPGCKTEIEQNYMGNGLKAITAYFGELIYDENEEQDEEYDDMDEWQVSVWSYLHTKWLRALLRCLLYDTLLQRNCAILSSVIVSHLVVLLDIPKAVKNIYKINRKEEMKWWSVNYFTIKKKCAYCLCMKKIYIFIIVNRSLCSDSQTVLRFH